MKKFKFKLQSLMNLRERREEEAKKNYRESLKKINDEENKLLEMKTELKKFESEYQKTISINPELMSQFYLYYEKLEHNVIEQREQVALAKQEMEINKKNLIEARKERKKIEKIKENELERYLDEVKKAEQKFIDEIATQKFNEKKKNK